MPRFRPAAFSLATFAILLLCTFALAQSIPVLVTQPVDNSVRTTLKGNVHPLARAQYDQGEVPAGMALHRLLLVLKRSDQQETALRRLIENQQYKNSSSYHQWLTPEQFGAQFGPANSDMAAVVNWLTASGFAVTQITNGRNIIEFNGTAGQIKQAFGTALHKYLINGEEHIANSSDPSIPTALAPIIAGVNSLHDFRKQAQNIHVGTYSEKTKQLTPAPDFDTVIQGSQFYAVSPYDFANIYDEIPLWNAATPINGSGVTIAIVGRTDINPNDATTFWSLFGLDGTHAPQPTLTIYTNGVDPGFTSDESEADIDTQWSGSVAPGATIDFVTSASTETTDGVDLSALYIVGNNLAPVMSESYGQCEAALGQGGVDFYGGMWEEAAAQGISVMVSTGDDGAAGCDDPGAPAQNGLNVSGLASTPWNAAVGGTDFNQYNNWSTYWNSTNDAITQQSVKNNTYIPESAWNDSCANPLLSQVQGGSTNQETNCNNSNFSGLLDSTGGSGGRSGYSAGGFVSGLGWATPTWQTGIPNPHDGVRDLPDVSLFASNGFIGSLYVICQSDLSPGNGQECGLSDLQGFGGTSVASPAFAGIMALVNQQYGPQGVPGLILYALNSKVPTAFHDINKFFGTTTSTNAMPCFKDTPDCVTNVQTDNYGILSGYNTGAGYDMVTGIGSVDANVLVTNWNKVTFTPSKTTLTMSPMGGITHGQTINVTVTAAPESGSGTPTGDVSILVSPQPGKPAIDWNSLSSGTVTWPSTLFPGGTYQVIAHYAGDTTFGGSYSTASASITISPEASTVYMPGIATPGGYSSGPVVYGANPPGCDFSCDAYWLRTDIQNATGQYCTTQSQGEIACPTGTVTFTDNGSQVTGSPFKLNSFGFTDDYSLDYLAQFTGGNHILIANYSGDASYKAGSSTPFTLTVSPASTTFSAISVPGSAPAGQNFTVTATVDTTSYGVAPTGTVAFLANGTALPGTVTLTPTNGGTSGFAALAASLVTSISTAGTYSITATYTTADGNYSSQPTSAAAQINITSNQNVGLPPSLTSPAAANPGQTTTTTMAVTTSDGQPFVTNPTFGCSNLPTGVTCGFSPNLQGMQSGSIVTITVTTAGPFTGVAGGSRPGNVRPGNVRPNSVRPVRPRAASEMPRLWLPLSLPLFGVVFVGLAGRGMRRRHKIIGLLLMLALAGLLIACGGSSSGPPPAMVTPATAQVELGGTQQFNSSVANVTWSVTAGVGTISPSGLYSAPPSGSTPASATVTATPTSGAPGTAAVTIPAVGVSVSPNPVNILYPNGILAGEPEQQTQFSATVTEATNTAVTWAITSGGTDDSISSTGLYTAPTAVPPGPVTITATSQADGTKFGTATVNIQTPTPAGTTKITVSGSENSQPTQTTTFNLTVN